MNSDKPIVLVTEGSHPGPLEWLAQRVRMVEAKITDPSFNQHLTQAQGMVVRTYTQINEALLRKAPGLKVVGRGGVGLENIDVAACRKHGVQVVYTPDANTLAVGDFVFGYILQLLRPWALFNQKAYEAAQFKKIRDSVRGYQLNELTIGILGMGRVGRRVGHIAADGFGMRVLYNDLADVSSLVKFPAQSVDKETLYRSADILTIHVDMRPGNQDLVGPDALDLLKPTAIVINTSRGQVLNAQALANALRHGKLAGAALDVFDPEPPTPNFPLLGIPNVLLTPHLAARTHTAIENMSWVVRDVVAVLEGQPPKYPAP